jgi:germination protein M
MGGFFMKWKKKVLALLSVLTISSLLSGCSFGLNPFSDKEKMDPPNVNYVKKADELDDDESESKDLAKKIPTELYLVDKNGYVVPTALALPNTQSVAKQALEYLVQDGPVTDLLPNGFQAILPPETVIKSIDVQNGVATVDFSKEFKNYQAANENRILQSVVWTLTQFDSIGSVALRIEGKSLAEMPVSKTPIASKLTRQIGINNESTQLADIMNTHPITVYFVATNKKANYYVPVTRRVSNSGTNDVVTVVKELVKGAAIGSNLASDFATDLALIDTPNIDNGVVSLNFNQNLYTSASDKEKKTVSSKLLDALVLSLTENKSIQKVSVTVNGSKELSNEDGKPLTAPVSRPNKVNAVAF